MNCRYRHASPSFPPTFLSYLPPVFPLTSPAHPFRGPPKYSYRVWVSTENFPTESRQSPADKRFLVKITVFLITLLTLICTGLLGVHLFRHLWICSCRGLNKNGHQHCLVCSCDFFVDVWEKLAKRGPWTPQNGHWSSNSTSSICCGLVLDVMHSFWSVVDLLCSGVWA